MQIHLNPSLRLSDFPHTTGRGMMATTFIKEGQDLVCVPQSQLITKSLLIKQYGSSSTKTKALLRSLTDAQAIMTWLLLQRTNGQARLKKYEKYVRVLSNLDFSSMPLNYPSSMLDLLPWDMKHAVLDQLRKMDNDFKHIVS